MTADLPAAAPAAVTTPTRLFLLRHGEVETKYHRVFGGSRIDMELSPAGHAQAERLANWLARTPFDAVYASPMRRVALTYEPFRRHFTGEPVILPGLREIDFGDWTGFGWNEVEARFGMSAYDWLHHLEHDRVAGAESLAHFRDRLAASVRQILAEQPGKTVAVFCHGGVIRGLLSQLLDQPLRWFEHIEVEYASATWVDVGLSKAGKARNEIQLLNFTPWRDLP
ncbi:MAG TPA: histidine phosphatase family protein [Candidatus Limnocylindria bacterium]|nr:histidine phosphatase family protein [Candidatus Limnocylindria bacterium]